jgi:hypothetical protein
MPLILIIVGIITALGVGGFLFLQTPESDITLIEAPVARVEETTTPDTTPAVDTNSETSATTGTAPVDDTSIYANGTYDASATYTTPGRSSHNVNITLTLTGDVITASNVTFTGDDNKTSAGLQTKFAAAYQTQVVGKKIDDVSLARVGGASLTTNAFNQALAEVKASAKS